MRKVFLIVAMSVGMLSFAQEQKIGINIALPKTTLDVNGDLTVREVNKISGKTEKLYVDNDGKLGLDYRPKQVVEALVFSANTERRIVNTSGTTSFNNGVHFELWVKPEDIKLNSIGITHSGNYFKIGETGTYMVSGFVNFLIESTIGHNTFMVVTIETSTNNGTTWSHISGSMPIFAQSATEQYHGHSIPTTVTDLSAGTLIRIAFQRTKLDGDFLGDRASKMSVEGIESDGIKAMDFLIRKL